MAEAKIVLTAVDQTKAAIESAQRNMASLSDTVTRVTGLMGPLAAAITAAFSIEHFKGVLDLMDKLDDMSEKTGVSVESLTKLRYAGETVGTSTEQLGQGLKKLAKIMGDAAGGSDEATSVFKAMGVSFKDSAGNLRPTEQVLTDIAEKFSGWADGPEKAALAMKVFGKSGEDMIPFLNLGAAGLAASADEAKRLGIELGGGAAKAAADFNDRLKKMSLYSEAVNQKLIGDFLPGLNKMAADFLKAAENSNTFVAALISVREALKSTFGMDAAGIMESELKARGNGIALLGRQLDIAQKQAESGISGAADRVKNIRVQLESAIAASAKISENLKQLVNLEKPASVVSTNKPAAPIVPKKDGPQSDFAANFINSLTTQYAALGGAMSKVDEVQRMLAVSGDKFTAQQRTQALSLAKEIDLYRYKQLVMTAENKSLSERGALQEASQELYARNLVALRDEALALQINAGYIGKTSAEIERLRFERELSIKLTQAESQIMADQNAGLIEQAEAARRLAAVKRFASEAQTQFNIIQADQLDQQNNALRGLSDGLRDYMREAAKMGDATKNAVTNAFRGMEDAMVEFVKTGKLNFSSLANSIVSDLIRIQVQQSITGPLSGILKNSLGYLFGGGQMGPSQTAPSLPSSFDQYITTSANGNVMTPYGPMALNQYANGGIATSPQLSIFGEGRMNEAYVPLPDGRTIPVTMSGNGGGSNVIVNVMPTSGQTADVQQRKNSDGSITLDVMLRQIESGIAGNISAGSGPAFNAISSRFIPQGAR